MKLLSNSLFSVICVNLLATSGDITISWTSPMYHKLYSNDSTINPIGRPITENEDAWIGSLLTLGAVVGPFPYSLISKTFGRKIALLAIGFPHIISYIIFSFAQDVYLFYFARFLGGLAIGGGYCLLPMYIAEVSPETHRGAMTETLNIFWAIGNFLPFAIGPFVPVRSFNLILSVIPIVFFFTFLIFGTETPFYYAKRNKMEKAEQLLMHLRSKTKEEIQDELRGIKKYIKMNENGKLTDIIKNKVTRRCLIICLILISTQDLSGFCAITFHVQMIFDAAVTTMGSDFASLIIGIGIVCTSFFTPFLVDKVGRRFLAISSCLGMCASHILIGVFFYIKDLTSYNTSGISWLPILGLVTYNFAFNFGICSVPWTLASELFPSNCKEVASLVVSFFCWSSSFIMTSCFNSINDALGRSGTFWFFGAACLGSAIFSFLFVPETKGKTFVEIQEMLIYGASVVDDNPEEVMLQKS